MDAALP